MTKRKNSFSLQRKALNVLAQLRRLSKAHRERGEVLDNRAWLKVLANVLSSAPAGYMGSRKARTAPPFYFGLTFENLKAQAVECGLDVSDAEIEAQRSDTLAWRDTVSKKKGKPFLGTMSMDKMGALLGVTEETRFEVLAWNIGTYGGSPAQRARAAKERDKARKARERREKGSPTWKERYANNFSKSRPWEAEGISRAKWYRLRAIGSDQELENETAASESPERDPACNVELRQPRPGPLEGNDATASEASRGKQSVTNKLRQPRPRQPRPGPLEARETAASGTSCPLRDSENRLFDAKRKNPEVEDHPAGAARVTARPVEAESDQSGISVTLPDSIHQEIDSSPARDGRERDAREDARPLDQADAIENPPELNNPIEANMNDMDDRPETEEEAAERLMAFDEWCERFSDPPPRKMICGVLDSRSEAFKKLTADIVAAAGNRKIPDEFRAGQYEWLAAKALAAAGMPEEEIGLEAMQEAVRAALKAAAGAETPPALDPETEAEIDAIAERTCEFTARTARGEIETWGDPVLTLEWHRELAIEQATVPVAWLRRDHGLVELAAIRVEREIARRNAAARDRGVDLGAIFRAPRLCAAE